MNKNKPDIFIIVIIILIIIIGVVAIIIDSENAKTDPIIRAAQSEEVSESTNSASNAEIISEKIENEISEPVETDVSETVKKNTTEQVIKAASLDGFSIEYEKAEGPDKFDVIINNQHSDFGCLDAQPIFDKNIINIDSVTAAEYTGAPVWNNEQSNPFYGRISVLNMALLKNSPTGELVRYKLSVKQPTTFEFKIINYCNIVPEEFLGTGSLFVDIK